jgi:Holliday junction DNA helicase RuvA
MFNLLISVSGIGPNTAILMLSSLTPSEVATAIGSEDVTTIQGVKGIGLKTAQRVIVDLKDKMLKFGLIEESGTITNNTIRFDALTALVSLGFDKKAAEKSLSRVFADQATVELLIKDALKVL